MRELCIEQMEAIHGEGLCYGGGIALVAGVALVGVGFLVAGGLGSYFGTTVGLICAMDPHRK